MTTAECARRAKERYLTVFALQYGGECFGCEYTRLLLKIITTDRSLPVSGKQCILCIADG
jgi:hypothetical protein